jgi:hypothetical protein
MTSFKIGPFIIRLNKLKEYRENLIRHKEIITWPFQPNTPGLVQHPLLKFWNRPYADLLGKVRNSKETLNLENYLTLSKAH